MGGSRGKGRKSLWLLLLEGGVELQQVQGDRRLQMLVCCSRVKVGEQREDGEEERM